MMNKIFWDLINTEEVTSFIDDVIIGTEKGKKYDKIIEEVVRRLVENNLYIKCKWKVRKVRYLEVVIELKEIKIKKDKIKGVLE